MDANQTCDLLLSYIKKSNLNWSITESPFSVSVTLKKTFIKNKDGSLCESGLEPTTFPSQQGKSSIHMKPSCQQQTLVNPYPTKNTLPSSFLDQPMAKTTFNLLNPSMNNTSLNSMTSSVTKDTRISQINIIPSSESPSSNTLDRTSANMEPFHEYPLTTFMDPFSADDDTTVFGFRREYFGMTVEEFEELRENLGEKKNFEAD